MSSRSPGPRISCRPNGKIEIGRAETIAAGIVARETPVTRAVDEGETIVAAAVVVEIDPAVIDRAVIDRVGIDRAVIAAVIAGEDAAAIDRAAAEAAAEIVEGRPAATNRKASITRSSRRSRATRRSA
jgi:hypothetical protein